MFILSTEEVETELALIFCRLILSSFLHSSLHSLPPAMDLSLLSESAAAELLDSSLQHCSLSFLCSVSLINSMSLILLL